MIQHRETTSYLPFIAFIFAGWIWLSCSTTKNLTEVIPKQEIDYIFSLLLQQSSCTAKCVFQLILICNCLNIF